MATLHIVRGLPGSGKSTFAKQLAIQLGCRHFEADMFFTDENGNYNFDRQKIGDAHEWCRDSVLAEVCEGRDVVVSNTFTTPTELEAYLRSHDLGVWLLAMKLHEMTVIIYEMTGNYGSIHNVPLETLERMRKRWFTNEQLRMLLDEGDLDVYYEVTFKTINS